MECWHPYLRRQQPVEMWLPVRRSGFTDRAVWAGIGRICDPLLVDQIDVACVVRGRQIVLGREYATRQQALDAVAVLT